MRIRSQRRACALAVASAVPVLNVVLWIVVALQAPPPAIVRPHPWAILFELARLSAPSMEPTMSPPATNTAAPSAVAASPSALRPARRPVQSSLRHGDTVDPWGAREVSR